MDRKLILFDEDLLQTIAGRYPGTIYTKALDDLHRRRGNGEFVAAFVDEDDGNLCVGPCPPHLLKSQCP